DVNGDGLPDRVMRSRLQPYTYLLVQINTGCGFAASRNLGPLNNATTSKEYGSVTLSGHNGADSSSATLVELIDMNGDGLVDRAHGSEVQTNKGPFPDLLCVISNGIGGSIRVAYKPSTQFDNRDKDWSVDPWSEGARSLLSFPIQVVSTVT